MPNWMKKLARHYEKTRKKYPDDELIILFDIDGTILDMRHMVVHVLKAYDAAHETPLYSIQEWIDFPDAEWAPVDGETEVLSGIKVLPTPGHTPGHQSVVVTHTEGVEAIAGQAVYDAAELDSESSIEPLSDAEAEATTASARRIKAANPDRVFFSHDPRLWSPPTVRTPT